MSPLSLVLLFLGCAANAHVNSAVGKAQTVGSSQGWDPRGSAAAAAYSGWAPVPTPISSSPWDPNGAASFSNGLGPDRTDWAAQQLSPPSPGARGCDVQPGDRIITSLQLYPENGDFDPRRCVIYFSVLWNSSVAIYDPISNTVIGSITDRRFTGRPELHASGIQVDVAHDKLAIMFNAGAPFDTAGENIMGQNNLVQYDLKTNKVLWAIDLSKVTNGAYSGFQDMEHDRHGNIFVCGTFPPSLLFVNATTVVASPWWLGPHNMTNKGINGLAMWRYSKLLGTYQDGYDQYGSHLIRWNVRVPGEPVGIPIYKNGRAVALGTDLDGSYLPLRYGGNILLVTDAWIGTIVLHSTDAWETAEKLGVLPNPFAGGTSATATVQAGQRIFAIFEFFQDATVKAVGQPAGAGQRSKFPLLDVTDQIDALVPEYLRRAIGSGSIDSDPGGY
ncbi:hypothetical protein HIM_05788 [Hirsutella minnesotensis 3608]|uniref:SMP-30/Gluconolactonase/LRE-like region domain-containing protein n=1 Tax=Hirsutella minnesotensis 3608 TaxID=1043627 RepID=A0A0F8A583_9HYPO|nr:hypothetical protein HIM_05788 [Hirsutella minnesotensis 3608]